jgi:oxygen-independent coproporphyrinogen-3 oxidase
MTPHDIYIHVPFCASKCNYCAFYSVACGKPDWNAYADGIINEISFWKKRIGSCPVPTIFFGGGTPSLMPTSIFARIIDSLHANFKIAENAEVTLESNPGTLDDKRLREFVNLGANRLSVGVQSLDDASLKFLGRAHDSYAARALIGSAQDIGLNVSADFIYALPGQTLQDIEKMCRDILELNLPHTSIYELSIELGTPLAKAGVAPVDGGLGADMYDMIGEVLGASLQRYEVSNYAKPRFECRHNSNIWDGAAYIGLGPSACGRPFYDGQWWETSSLANSPLAGESAALFCAPVEGIHSPDHTPHRRFASTLPQGGSLGTELVCDPIDNRLRAVEMLITGLRTRTGARLTSEVKKIIDWDYVKANPDLIQITDYGLRITITSKGILLLDSIMLKLIS